MDPKEKAQKCKHDPDTRKMGRDSNNRHCHYTIHMYYFGFFQVFWVFAKTLKIICVSVFRGV